MCVFSGPVYKSTFGFALEQTQNRSLYTVCSARRRCERRRKRRLDALAFVWWDRRR